ncbi:MAG: YIP1 family protein [Rhodobacteraceae bacterium]|jgi:hypothetical protein|uniref:Yip1 domain-containing protein n=1 Tax=Salipiger profundus TaxID=1229727 RepID=A0A1U7DBR9_9RHOB|nr:MULTISPECIES: YIP1 family protein [Salipiger]APX25516.1 Yip1 domain-containing protein [Salipiger profundus]MAB06210.1 YIP1 family protein [Paracoccaceae bacterium]GGA04883.1 hypothetical protein GCM10011326_16030 [Salipiger profundus]SFD69540.1 Yip1 domain-containing protein [Salipiger profundus]
MSPAGFLRLAWQTVVAPRQVAQLLLSLRLGHEAILTALALVVTLNALAIGAMQAAMPGSASLPFVMSPMVTVALVAAMLTASIFLMTWAGRLFGGHARTEDIALLLTWLQALRLLGQVIVAFATVVSGALASLVVIAALLIGIWILINFLDVAHGFGNPFKALMVLILGSVALVLGLSFLFTLVGIGPNAMAI